MPNRVRPAVAVQPKAGKKIVFGDDATLDDASGVQSADAVEAAGSDSDDDEEDDDDDEPEIVGLATGRQAAEEEANKAESSKQAQRKSQQARSAKIQERREREDAEREVRARMARATAQADEDEEDDDGSDASGSGDDGLEVEDDEEQDSHAEMASFHTGSEEGDSDGESFGDDVPDAAMQARMQAHMEAVEAAAAVADGRAPPKKAKGKVEKATSAMTTHVAPVGEDGSEFDLGPAPLPASLLKQAEQARLRSLKRAAEEGKQKVADKRRKKRVAKEIHMRSIDSRTNLHLVTSIDAVVPPLVPARTHVNGPKTVAAAFHKQAMKRSGLGAGARGAKRSRAHLAMASETGLNPEHFRRGKA